MIHEYPVKYHFAYQFKDLAVAEGCVYKNMIEQISRQLLLCILDVPDDKEELISDMAFQTFVKNPEFQKYYDRKPDILEQIKKDNELYKWGLEQKEKLQIPLPTSTLDDQVVVRLIAEGVYPFYSNKLNDFIYFIDANSKIIGTKNKAEFENRWDRQLVYLGEGQLNEHQKEQVKKYLSI